MKELKVSLCQMSCFCTIKFNLDLECVDMHLLQLSKEIILWVVDVLGRFVRILSVQSNFVVHTFLANVPIL